MLKKIFLNVEFNLGSDSDLNGLVELLKTFCLTVEIRKNQNKPDCQAIAKDVIDEFQPSLIDLASFFSAAKGTWNSFYYIAIFLSIFKLFFKSPSKLLKSFIYLQPKFTLLKEMIPLNYLGIYGKHLPILAFILILSIICIYFSFSLYLSVSFILAILLYRFLDHLKVEPKWRLGIATGAFLIVVLNSLLNYLILYIKSFLSLIALIVAGCIYVHFYYQKH